MINKAAELELAVLLIGDLQVYIKTSTTSMVILRYNRASIKDIKGSRYKFVWIAIRYYHFIR